MIIQPDFLTIRPILGGGSDDRQFGKSGRLKPGGELCLTPH
jgi:hypothetical protein